MLRRLSLFVALLCLGCSAQNATSPNVDRRIEQQIRATYHIPASVPISIGERKPSSDFSGYSVVKVSFGRGEKTQDFDFLLSKDEKTLVQVTKMDLSKDPGLETMKKIDVTGRPVRGPKDAKVTIVVYDDFQCPFCSRMHATLFQDVMKEYGDRVKVIYKDYPLFEIHPWAGRAAVNADCLASQNGGAYWDFADTLHYNGKQIQGTNRPLEGQIAELDRVTMEIGKKHSLDLTKLTQCVKDQNQDVVMASVKEARALGVDGTPALFVNGVRLDGAVPAADVKATIDQALRDAGEKVPEDRPADVKTGGSK